MSETTVTTTEQTTVVETVEQIVVIQVITPEGTDLVETDQGTAVVEVYVQGPQGPQGEGADVLTQSISDGDTTHAPSGDAVFDALAAQTAATAAVAADLATHEADTANPHAVTKAQVGLASADNTADTDKPVSTAQAAAIAAALSTAQSYADAAVAGLWDDRGNYDASGNVFPSSGGSGTAGAVLKGDIWTVSVDGTLGGATVQVGDTVRALVDTPAQTAGNWALGERNFAGTPEPAQTAASQAEAEAGTETAIRSFSPLRILQAIAAKLSLGTWISGATSKATPVDADTLPLSDSAASGALKSLTWANLKATLGALTNWLSVNALGQGGASSGQALVWNGSAWAPATIAATPAGSGAELQYRNAGSFGAAAVTHYDSTNGRLSIGAGTSPVGTTHIKPASASIVPVTVDGATSQTANLQDYRLANGNLLLSVVGKSTTIGDCGIIGNTGFSIEPFLRAYAWWFQDSSTNRYAGFDTVYGYNKLTLASTTRMGWSSSTDARAAGDTFLMRAGAAFVAPYGASLVGGGFELLEMSTPSAPSSNRVRLYSDDNGSGKTRVMALFPTGAAQQLAIEP